MQCPTQLPVSDQQNLVLSGYQEACPSCEELTPRDVAAISKAFAKAQLVQDHISYIFKKRLY